MFDFDREQFAESYRRFVAAVRNYVLLVLVLLAVAYFVGIPHLQTTYTYVGPRPDDGITRACQKTEAWYVGPSRNGFHLVEAGQYGHVGCPFILFIPFEDCYSLPWASDD